MINEGTKWKDQIGISTSWVSLIQLVVDPHVLGGGQVLSQSKIEKSSPLATPTNYGGQNGAPKGLPHCSELDGCLRENLKIPSGERHELCRGVHAEQNVIIQAAVHGVSTKNATIYCSTYPCSICAKLIINAKISKVVYIDDYEDARAKKLFKNTNIKVIRLKNV